MHISQILSVPKISFELEEPLPPHLSFFVCVTKTKMYSPNLNCSSALEVMCLSGFPRRHSRGDFGGFLILGWESVNSVHYFFVKIWIENQSWKFWQPCGLFRDCFRFDYVMSDHNFLEGSFAYKLSTLIWPKFISHYDEKSTNFETYHESKICQNSKPWFKSFLVEKSHLFGFYTSTFYVAVKTTYIIKKFQTATSRETFSISV